MISEIAGVCGSIRQQDSDILLIDLCFDRFCHALLVAK